MGLERLMLEASGFDFRNRYPQKLLMKLVRSCKFDKDTVGMTAYRISLDLYRTFAPLKQTTPAMAMACLELAARLCAAELSSVTAETGFDYKKWATSRAEIMGWRISVPEALLNLLTSMHRAETLVDLLDLYTQHRAATTVGPDYPLDTFIAIRIALNQEAHANKYPRYTQWKDLPPTDLDTKKTNPGTKSTNGSMITPTSISPQSPSTTAGTVGERGKDGTLRFMLNPGRARDEKMIVKEFFKIEEVEEYVY